VFMAWLAKHVIHEMTALRVEVREWHESSVSVIIYLTTIEGCGILHLEAAYEPDRCCQTVRHAGSLQRFS
jgi:hypothetical protein